MLRRRNDAFRGTPRELHGGAILFVQNYLLKLGCSRVVPSLILAGQARQFGEKNVLYKSYASSSKIQRQTETILWRFLECTRQKLIVPSPFIGRHHVVMHYMARWMDFPLPTPLFPLFSSPSKKRQPTATACILNLATRSRFQLFSRKTSVGVVT